MEHAIASAPAAPLAPPPPVTREPEPEQPEQKVGSVVRVPKPRLDRNAAKRSGSESRLNELLADLKRAGLTPAELKSFNRTELEAQLDGARLEIGDLQEAVIALTQRAEAAEDANQQMLSAAHQQEAAIWENFKRQCQAASEKLPGFSAAVQQIGNLPVHWLRVIAELPNAVQFVFFLGGSPDFRLYLGQLKDEVAIQRLRQAARDLERDTARIGA